MPAQDVRLQRARAQRLTDDTAVNGPVQEVVRALLAVQAQAMPAATLAIRPRSRGLRAVDVTRALNEERSVVRTWAMRGTLHLLAAQDVAWVVSLLGPVFAARGRGRRQQLGIDDALAERALRAIRQALEHGPLTRAEVIDRLAARGIAFEAKSQGPIHLIAMAALEGVLCYGPERDRAETFVLLADWVPGHQAMPGPAALRELARRYAAAHAPADVRDLAAWSGLPVAMLGEVAGLLQPAADRGEPGSGSVRLLPAFDEYLLGYRSRAFAVPPILERRLQRGGGWIHPAVVVDGRAVGAWASVRQGRGLGVRVELIDRARAAMVSGVEAEVSDLGRYLETETQLLEVALVGAPA